MSTPVQIELSHLVNLTNALTYKTAKVEELTERVNGLTAEKEKVQNELRALRATLSAGSSAPEKAGQAI